tara:strand:+ start:302 stop:2440 length:2139 start_codon:yes stop_codon:yes gene_type:complete
MNFPHRPSEFFKWISDDNPAMMNHLLNKPIDKKTSNTTSGKKLVESFKGINNEDDFEDHFAEKFPKIFENIIESIEDAGEQAKKIEKMFANFQLVRSKLQETYSRPKEYLSDKSIVQKIIEKEGNEEQNIEDLFENLMKKVEDTNDISNSSFIKTLKRGLGLDERENLIKLKNKLQEYFQNEEALTISDFLNGRTPNFNFAYVKLTIDVPKDAKVNFKPLREKGWGEGKNNIFGKMVKASQVKQTIGEIKDSKYNLVTVGKDSVKAPMESEINFSIFYEIVIQSDYVMRNAVTLKRTNKSSMKLTVTASLDSGDISKYLKVLEMADKKIKSKDKGTKTQEKAVSDLFFKIKGQQLNGMKKNLFTKKGSQYFMLPLYKQFLSKGTLSDPINQSIKFIKYGAAIDRTAYLNDYLSDKSGKDKKTTRASIESGEGAEFENFENRYEEKIVSGDINAWDKKAIEFAIQEEELEFANYDPDDPNNARWEERKEEGGLVVEEGGLFDRKRFEDSLVSVGKLQYSKVKRYQDKLNDIFEDENFQVELKDNNIPIHSQTKALTPTVEFDANEYNTPLKQAIVQTMGWVKRNNTTMKDYLSTTQGTNDAAKKPLTLMKAVFLSNYLCVRYSGLSTGDLYASVKKIDSSISKGLSLADTTTVQAVDAFATSLEEGVVKFNAEFMSKLTTKLKDIASSPEKYDSLYHSKAMTELIRGKLLKEE